MSQAQLYILHLMFQVCIDVIVQRLGDASAAGMYKLLFDTLNGKASTASLCALPVCSLFVKKDVIVYSEMNCTF